MKTLRIDGKQHAAALLADVAAKVSLMQSETGVVPGLAVVLVGDDPASQVYVRNKAARTRDCGMHSFEHRLPASTSQAELLDLMRQLNADASVHGVLVQLPLPEHIDEAAVVAALEPAKDVDGFHPLNAGRLACGEPGLVPCTPWACMQLLRHSLGDLTGLHALVIGRSNIVGKPMARLLLQADCTVTVAHSRTRDLPRLCAGVDIVVAAVGRPGFVRGDWLKPGACVIDVGINRITQGGRDRLVGDVDFDGAWGVAGAITPVPGGVGPMTIASLLHNTWWAAKAAVEAAAGRVISPSHSL